MKCLIIHFIVVTHVDKNQGVMVRVAQIEEGLSLKVNDFNHLEAIGSNKPFKGTFKSPGQWLEMRYIGIQRNSVSQAVKLLTNERG